MNYVFRKLLSKINNIFEIMKSVRNIAVEMFMLLILYILTNGSTAHSQSKGCTLCHVMNKLGKEKKFRDIYIFG